MDINNKQAHNFKNLTGQIFGFLIVARFDCIKNKHTFWLCKCNCGGFKSINGDSLVRGLSNSCGCVNRELSRNRCKNRSIHNLAGTRFYRIWQNMKNRCLNPKHRSYKNYGGRGITICEKWLDFNNFKIDMYESYIKHVEEFGENNTSLDRVNNTLGYFIENCRWATSAEQQQNTRISAKSDNYAEHTHWKIKLRTRLNAVVNGYISDKLCVETFGIVKLEFKKYIESQFEEGMIWSKYGKDFGTWQIDHIKGVNNFDLSKKEDRLKAFHYTNLKPIWFADHTKKSVTRVVL